MMHHFVHNTEKHLLDLLLADIKIKMSRHPFKQWCESDFLTALLPPPPSFHSLSSLACRPPRLPPLLPAAQPYPQRGQQLGWL